MDDWTLRAAAAGQQAAAARQAWRANAILTVYAGMLARCDAAVIDVTDPAKDDCPMIAGWAIHAVDALMRQLEGRP